MKRCTQCKERHWRDGPLCHACLEHQLRRVRPRLEEEILGEDGCPRSVNRPISDFRTGEYTSDKIDKRLSEYRRTHRV